MSLKKLIKFATSRRMLTYYLSQENRRMEIILYVCVANSFLKNERVELEVQVEAQYLEC